MPVIIFKMIKKIRISEKYAFLLYKLIFSPENPIHIMHFQHLPESSAYSKLKKQQLVIVFQLCILSSTSIIDYTCAQVRIGLTN